MSDIRWHIPRWTPAQIDQGLRALVIMGIVERSERKDGETVYWLAVRPEPERYRPGLDVERVKTAVLHGIVIGAILGLVALVLLGYMRAP